MNHYDFFYLRFLDVDIAQNYPVTGSYLSGCLNNFKRQTLTLEIPSRRSKREVATPEER